MPTSHPSPEQLYGSGLDHRGLAAVALLVFQSNAFIHREIVRQGRYEFLFQQARRNDLGLSVRDVVWIWDRLVETKPPELSELPNGTILDERGHVVPPTKADLEAAERIGLDRQLHTVRKTPRVFLG